MRLRNGGHGYGSVTKALHWLTAAALVVQLVVGYRLDADEALDREADGHDDRADAAEERTERAGDGEAAEERREALAERRETELEAREEEVYADAVVDVVTGRGLLDGVSTAELHVLLGLLVLILGLARLAWRAATPLPPWAPALGPAERRVEAYVENVLVALLLVVPATGLLLALGSDDLLPVHVASHLALFGAVAVHAAVVLRHTVVRRERHLHRML